MAMPLHSKHPKSSWNGDEKIQQMIVSLQGYAMGDCKNEDQKKMAAKILKAMVLTKSAFSAANLLIDIGYFPLHVNLDLLKSNIPNYSDEIISAAESLMAESSDPDELGRMDLTHLKIYAIDVDEAEEDGRIKVWIHVADPTSLVQPGSIIDSVCEFDSIAEYTVGNSIIKPTYLLTYESVSELLHLDLEGKVELKVLSKAAMLRLKWRRQ